MSGLKPIRTEEDYETALARIDALMDAEPGSPEGDELTCWSTWSSCMRASASRQQNYRLLSQFVGTGEVRRQFGMST